MNEEMITLMFCMNKQEILIALRNYLLRVLSEGGLKSAARLFGDNDFQGVLNTLDPDMPDSAENVEQALRAFELGLRFLS